MKVLLIGAGAREHALAWKLAQSPSIKDLILWPTNPLATAWGRPLPLPSTASWAEVAQAARQENVDFVVVGPEKPLAEGFSDLCRGHGIPVFGPSAAAARLESSKAFAKDVMASAGIPTAAHLTVSELKAARQAAADFFAKDGGVVLKASGLAAGKGVFVCQSMEAVDEGLQHLASPAFQQAAQDIVIEELMHGRECSFFVFVGDDGASPIGFAVDYKRLKNNDAGPNTGGMGCYTPVPWLPADAGRTVMQEVVEPLLAELKKRDIPYCGCLYVGLMWTERGPRVVEFNVRLGDPEAEVLAVHDRRDWGAMLAGKLGLPAAHANFSYEQDFSQGATVCVVMASQGYPYGDNEGGFVRFTQEQLQAATAAGPAHIFAAAIHGHQEDASITTAAGRVFTISAHGRDFTDARHKAYATVRQLQQNFASAQYRDDIGAATIN